MSLLLGESLPAKLNRNFNPNAHPGDRGLTVSERTSPNPSYNQPYRTFDQAAAQYQSNPIAINSMRSIPAQGQPYFSQNPLMINPPVVRIDDQTQFNQQQNVMYHQAPAPSQEQGMTNIYNSNMEVSPIQTGLHNIYHQQPANSGNIMVSQPTAQNPIYQLNNPRSSNGQKPPQVMENQSQYMDFQVRPAAKPVDSPGQLTLVRRQANSYAVRPNSAQVVPRKSNNILPDSIDPIYKPYHKDSAMNPNFDLGLGGPISAASFGEVQYQKQQPQEKPIKPMMSNFGPIQYHSAYDRQEGPGAALYQSNPAGQISQPQVNAVGPQSLDKSRHGERIPFQPDPNHKPRTSGTKQRITEIMERYNKRIETADQRQPNQPHPQKVREQ